MPRAILDEFTSRRDLSRQRKYQLRADRDGLCRLCGRKRLEDGGWNMCAECKEAHRTGKRRCTAAASTTYVASDYI